MIRNCLFKLIFLSGILLGNTVIYAQPLLIPSPQQTIYREGKFQMNELVPVFLDKKATLEEKQAVWMLCESYAVIFGKELSITSNKNIGKAIFLRNLSLEKASRNREKTILPVGDEGYQLNIFPEKIEIVANSNAGLFYGSQTLLQLFRTTSLFGSLDCMTINDIPEINVRGWKYNLSPDRIPVYDYLRELIVLTSHYKYNVLDLSDNEVTGTLSDVEIFYLQKFAQTYYTKLIVDPSLMTAVAQCHLDDNEAIYPSFRESARQISDFLSDNQLPEASLSFSRNTERLFMDNWYLLLWGAENMWNPLKHKESLQQRIMHYNKALDIQFFETEYPLTTKLQEMDSLKMIPLNNMVYWVPVEYHEDMPDHIEFDKKVMEKSSLLEEALGFVATSYTIRHDEILFSAIFALQRIGFIALKDAVQVIMHQLGTGQDIDLDETVRILQVLEQNSIHLKAAHTALWDIENRSDFPERFSIRYDQFQHELSSLREQLIQQY